MEVVALGEFVIARHGVYVYLKLLRLELWAVRVEFRLNSQMILE
jgi:hypothetical protein